MKTAPAFAQAQERDDHLYKAFEYSMAKGGDAWRASQRGGYGRGAVGANFQNPTSARHGESDVHVRLLKPEDPSHHGPVNLIPTFFSERLIFGLYYSVLADEEDATEPDPRSSRAFPSKGPMSFCYTSAKASSILLESLDKNSRKSYRTRHRQKSRCCCPRPS